LSRQLAQFAALDHVIVSPEGGGFRGITDEALAGAGLARRVVLSVPHFLFVMSVLGNTDLVAMLPSRLVRGCAALRVVEAPVDVPGFVVAEFAGAMAATWLFRWLVPTLPGMAERVVVPRPEGARE